MTVIPFPISRVVIDGGTITNSILIDADGRHHLADEVGRQVYFVRIEASDYRDVLGEYDSHAAALTAAVSAAHEHRCRVIDQTGDAA